MPGSWTGLSAHALGPSGDTPPKGYDASPISIHYPNESLTAEALHRGELPTWNPFAGTGAPALGGGSVYPFSPFFWPFYLLPGPWIYTMGLFLLCLWGGIGVLRNPVVSWQEAHGEPAPLRVRW